MLGGNELLLQKKIGVSGGLEARTNTRKMTGILKGKHWFWDSR